MEYLILAYDGKDSEAIKRRMAVREDHLRMAKNLRSEGKSIIGGAILDERDEMIGSARIVRFESRSELDHWLASEPYVTGKVWKHIEIIPFRIAPIYK